MTQRPVDSHKLEQASYKNLCDYNIRTSANCLSPRFAKTLMRIFDQLVEGIITHIKVYEGYCVYYVTTVYRT